MTKTKPSCKQDQPVAFNQRVMYGHKYVFILHSYPMHSGLMMPLLQQEDNQCLHPLCHDTVCVTLCKPLVWEETFSLWFSRQILMCIIDILISWRCSAISLHKPYWHCAICTGAVLQREEERAHRTVQFVFIEKKCRNVTLFHSTYRGQLSVTFPSSMGLSLMCTTGPGCVLVDLCKLERNKKTRVRVTAWLTWCNTDK